MVHDRDRAEAGVLGRDGDVGQLLEQPVGPASGVVEVGDVEVERDRHAHEDHGTLPGYAEPFRIDVPEAELRDLRERLARTRWPEAETVDDWSQGVPLAYMRELCGYWADGYDWRRHRGAAQRAARSSAPRSTGSASTSCTSARPHPTRCRSCSPTAGRLGRRVPRR